MAPRSYLATVLITDVVGSTERAAELRDEKWRDLRLNYHALVRAQLRRCGGREANSAGDGFLALFPEPERAILCAASIREHVRALGLEVRTGLHMGKVEGSRKELGGLTVHIAARVGAVARPGEILVTPSVQEALAGSAFDFEDRGSHVLKGVPGTWQLFAVIHVPAVESPRSKQSRFEALFRRRTVTVPLAATVAGFAVALAVIGRDDAREAGVDSSVGSLDLNTELASGPTAGAGRDSGQATSPARDPDGGSVPPSPATIPNSIAVLPFLNMSSDAENEYFSDGITEEMINALTTVPTLRVISRTSAFALKDSTLAANEIGRLLNVHNILEGSVRKVGDRLRITVQLIDATSGYHLWSDTFDRRLVDVFEIQQEIARTVAERLRIKLGVTEVAPDAAPTHDPIAYDLYLQGRHYYWNWRRREDLERSIRYYEEALARDESFALAYVGIANSYEDLADNFIPASEAEPKVEAAILRALGLDNRSAEVHAALGNVRLFHHRDWKGAEAEYQKALSLNPQYVETYHFYGSYLSRLNRLEEAIDLLHRAQSLDPLSPRLFFEAGRTLFWARRYDEAIREFTQLSQLGPEWFATAHASMGWALALKGSHAEALAELAAALERSPKSPRILSYMAYTHAAAGDVAAAQRILKEMEEISETEADYISPELYAIVYAGLGEDDRVFEWLNRARDAQVGALMELSVDPVWDPYRSDPRFTQLLRNVNLPL